MSSYDEQNRDMVPERLARKVAELRGKKHLPEELVALAASVAAIQARMASDVRYANDKRALPAEALKNLSDPGQRVSGLPVLPFRYFPLDADSARQTADAILNAVPDAAPQLARHAEALRAEFAADPGLLERVSHELRDPETRETELPLLSAWSAEHGDAPHFLRFVVTGASLPSFSAVGVLLGESHDPSQAWPHGHCPVCGSLPLLGRLEGKEGRRMHTCSFCCFEYRAPRLACPFCLTNHDEGAEYHVSEDEPGYLLSVCDQCGNYFKLADFREFDRPWFPLLDDLSSLTLDLYARQMGRTRPTLSGWGF